MIKCLLLISLLVTSIISWADEVPVVNCLENKDVEEVLPYFVQFNSLKEKSTEKICLENLEEESDQQSFHVLKSLIALKKLDGVLLDKVNHLNSDEVKNKEDEMNLKAISISEKNSWWKYLTDRAEKIIIDPPRCFYSRGTIAFVYGDSKSKTINICPLYFKTNILEQAETLLHEVRHFDGYAHVPCQRGIYKNSGNSCDESILDGGSYAVTIQVLVALSKIDTITKEEKYLLESLAVGRANNNFNKKINTEVISYAYLSNERGEVYRADINKLKKLEFVTTLKTPSLVYSGIRDFVIFPLDKSNATRVDKKFLMNAPDLGRFASKYNEEGLNERELYSQFEYYDEGGFLKDGVYYNSCGNSIDRYDAKGVRFSSMIRLENVSGAKETYLIDDEGLGHRVRCLPGIVSLIEVTKTNRRFPKDLAGGMSINSNSAIVLNKSGEILKLNLKSRKTSASGIIQRDWISLTFHDVYKIFD